MSKQDRFADIAQQGIGGRLELLMSPQPPIKENIIIPFEQVSNGYEPIVWQSFF